ncbi:glutamate--tRNA ligase [bacterium]|nr:glutamate--tRNA ligase [bacterium]
MNLKKPRVRFAPSPTGQLHLGGARTALFNWLYARKHCGKFLLRIEDTDKLRSKQEFTNQICESLRWLGLDWDEDIVFQSTRNELYNSVIEKLMKNGKAYRCFCSKERLAEERKQAEIAGSGYFYSGACRNLDEKVVQKNLKNGNSFSVRIYVPEGYTEFDDKIYGNIRVNNKEIDDFIIARTDGSPVYNLVVAVDDNDMGITHVIRGEDHISNTAKQIMVYKALNYPIPEFAHLPMILGPDKKRLSKRHGATGVQEYKDQGYLSDALVNYLALLGWNPGTEQEIFSPDELIEQFSIGRVQKKSAVFDEKKLQWVSGQHIIKKSANEILDNILTYDPNWQKSEDNDYVIKVIELMKDRVRSLRDMQNMTSMFFKDPKDYDVKAAKKKWNDNSINELIEKFNNLLENIELWDTENIEIALRNLAESKNISAGKIIHPTRLALSGIGSGPSLFDMMQLLGKETCIRRLRKANKILPY